MLSDGENPPHKQHFHPPLDYAHFDACNFSYLSDVYVLGRLVYVVGVGYAGSIVTLTGVISFCHIRRHALGTLSEYNLQRRQCCNCVSQRPLP